MIWISPARVMFLKHEVRPPEFIIVIHLTGLGEAASCADVRHGRSGRADKQLQLTKSLPLFTDRLGDSLFLVGKLTLQRGGI